MTSTKWSLTYPKAINIRPSILLGFWMVAMMLLTLSMCCRQLEGAVNSMNMTNPFESEGLTVLTSRSPGFDSELRALLAPDALQKASKFLSKSLILVNNTGRYIWGFTIVYTYPSRIADSGAAWR
jgi:hypothetical protein